MSTNAPPPLPPVGPLYGAIYFGTVICTAFYGITCVQTFFYYTNYEKDSIGIKIFVATLWILDTINEALSVSGAYKYIVAGIQNPYSYLIGNPELVLHLLSATALPAQGFFIYRIYIFSGRKFIVPILWIPPAILQLVTGIIYVARAFYRANGLQVVPLIELSDSTFTLLTTLCFVAAAGVDILIAILMTFLLVREKTSVRFTSTAYMLQRLIVFAVNTGTWTAMFALLTVVLMRVFPENALFVVPAIPLCSLYSNTVLANLNARAHLGGSGEVVGSVDTDAGSWQVRRGEAHDAA